MTFDMLVLSPGREGVTAITVPGSGSTAVQHIRQTPFLSHQGGHPDQSVQLHVDDLSNYEWIHACSILMNVILLSRIGPIVYVDHTVCTLVNPVYKHL